MPAGGKVDLDHLAVVVGGVLGDGGHFGKDAVDVEVSAAEIKPAVAVMGHPGAADLHLDGALDLLERQAGLGDIEGAPVLGRRGEARQVRCRRGDVEHRDDGVEAAPVGLELHEGEGEMLGSPEIVGEEVEVAVGPEFEVIGAVGRVFGEGAVGVEAVVRHADRQGPYVPG
ncbi:MAG: hypothetical protein V9G18_10560 [Albidovulum sp.]